ncbi:hypothetical protein HYW55_01690 [Candidatus Gottesmanbacteria bacterium]|nr:hypothetical protein [Candidatus Gottesmanbacteria bacterium]
MEIPNSKSQRSNKSQLSKSRYWKLKIENWKFQPLAGFTLIELIVSISVIFILVGMTFAGFASLNQRQTLLSSGQTVKNMLRDAQSRAINGEVDCSVCNCSQGSTILSGWYADFDSRTIYGKCGTNVFPTAGQPFGVSVEITIVPHLTPPTVLTFKSYPPGTDQKATICMSQTNLADQYYVIRVGQGGEISDDGRLVASCEPTP